MRRFLEEHLAGTTLILPAEDCTQLVVIRENSA